MLRRNLWRQRTPRPDTLRRVWLDDSVPLFGLDTPDRALMSTATMATGGNPATLHTRTLSYRGGDRRLLVTTYRHAAADIRLLQHALLSTLAGLANDATALTGAWMPVTVRVDGYPVQFLTAGPSERTWAAMGTVDSTLCTIQGHNIERTAVDLHRLQPRNHLPGPAR